MATTVIKNWATGTSFEVLEAIHEDLINISIYERDITNLQSEVGLLMAEDIAFRASGSVEEIVQKMHMVFDSERVKLLFHDANTLMQKFAKLSGAEHLRVLLTTVKTDMCRKFHTDINDLRMLCTYSGPGTLWLKEEHVNRDELGSRSSNAQIVLDKEKYSK